MSFSGDGDARQFLRNVLFTVCTYLFSWARAFFSSVFSVFSHAVELVFVRLFTSNGLSSSSGLSPHTLNFLSRLSITFLRKESVETQKLIPISSDEQMMPFRNARDKCMVR